MKPPYNTALHDDPVLTTSAAARMLGVAVSTAQLWIESGALDSWRTPGGHRRVRLSAVMQLLERARAGGTIAPGRIRVPEDLADEFLPLHQPAYPVPANEADRLRAVARSGLVGSPPEHAFDRLTWLATQVTDCKIALLSILTAQRQWFKSRIGLTLPETLRDHAFCNYTILSAEPFVVEDAANDARLRNNPLVIGEPFIRLYAGAAVSDGSGYRLGTLCVLDDVPRALEARQIRALQELAVIAAEEVQRREKRQS